MERSRLFASFRSSLTIAIVIGLGLGIVAGVAEAAAVLISGGLVGRYNELVPWAILFDSSVLIGSQFLLALILVGVSFFRRRPLSLRVLLLIQFGAGLWAVASGAVAWALVRGDPLSLVSLGWSGALIAMALGLAVTLVGMIILERATVRLSSHPVFRVRRWLALEIVACLVALLFGLDLHWPGPTTSQTVLATHAGAKPNVVIITIDTLRADSVGIYGNKVKTPNLDQLAQSGTWFTTDIVQQPNTNASHTSIFTGVFPFVHGVRQHMIDRLAPNVQTLAELLGQNGYKTAGLYSWVSLETGFSGLRGFETYEDLSIHLTPVLRDSRFQDLIVTYRLVGKYLLVPGLVENESLQGQQDSVEDTTDGKANVTADAAIRWLDVNSSNPFFLWVHFYDPHYPYTPPPPFDTMYDPEYTGNVDGGMDTIHYIYSHNTGALTQADVNHLQALYDGEISFTDQQVGRLLAEMDRLGLRDNTILVVTGDHGESLGTNGRWFHGSHLNYTDIHVPLIIRYPPAIPANRSITAPVESIDIMPTVLDLLKLAAPQNEQGLSLLPLIIGQVQGNDRIAITMLDTYKQISLVNSEWHLIWNRDKNSFELYDYHQDPLELSDQSNNEPDTVASLNQTLQARLRDLGFHDP